MILIPVYNAISRKIIRKMVVIRHLGYGDIALFGEPLQAVWRDIMKELGGPTWDPSWKSVIGAIGQLSPAGASPSESKDLFQCLVSVDSITNTFNLDPEANQATQTSFGCSFGSGAVRALTRGIDRSEIEIWEYTNSILSARLISAGVVDPDTLSGSKSLLSFQSRDRSMLYEKEDVLDYRILYADFPYAPYWAYSDFAPYIYGTVHDFSMPLIDEGAEAILGTALAESIEPAVATVTLDSSSAVRTEDFEGEGADSDDPFSIIIDEEIMLVKAKTSSVTFSVVRGGGQPAHPVGARIKHGSPRGRWLIANHDVDDPTDVVFVSESGSKLVPENDTEKGFGAYTSGVQLSTMRLSQSDSELTVGSSGGGQLRIEGEWRVRTPLGKYDIPFTNPQLGLPLTAFVPNGDASLNQWSNGTADCPISMTGQSLTSGIAGRIIRMDVSPQIEAPSIPPSDYTMVSSNFYFKSSVSLPEGQIPTFWFRWTLIDKNGNEREFFGLRISEDTADQTLSFSVPTEIDLSRINETVFGWWADRGSQPLGDITWNAVVGADIDNDDEFSAMSLIFSYTTEMFNVLQDSNPDNFISLRATGSEDFPLSGWFMRRYSTSRLNDGGQIVLGVTLRIVYYANVSPLSSLTAVLKIQGDESNAIELASSGTPGSPSTLEFNILTPSIGGGLASLDKWPSSVFSEEDQAKQPTLQVTFDSHSDADDLEFYSTEICLAIASESDFIRLRDHTPTATIVGLRDPDGTITGTVNAKIDNPSDVAKAIAIINHSRPVSEIHRSFDNARDYYDRNSGIFGKTISSSSTGVATVSASMTPGEFEGLILLDSNQNSYMITANTDFDIYIKDQVVPSIGSAKISGRWLFAGAITGEIGSHYLFGEIQRTFACKIGDDITEGKKVLKMLYPAFQVDVKPVARIFGLESEPHSYLPSYAMAGGDISFSRASDPIKTCEVLYKTRYFKTGQQQQNFQHSTKSVNYGIQRGRSVTIEARFIEDHHTAKLLAECMVSLFGQSYRVWQVPMPPDAMVALSWGNIVEVESRNLIEGLPFGLSGRKCQVVGKSYVPGQGGILSISDIPLYSDGPFS